MKRQQEIKEKNLQDDRGKMNGKLFSQAIAKVISGLFLMGVLLFLPAGSFSYWNAWLLIGILFIPMIAKRIRNEERVLEEGLEGYSDYKKRVKNKVIPGIW
ncbi:MAG: hypothetical protein K6G83_00565 [Lachnospiraceae bacterium]|nr:hypothetical protein [Lachnospiraceae bacterium]